MTGPPAYRDLSACGVPTGCPTAKARAVRVTGEHDSARGGGESRQRGGASRGSRAALRPTRGRSHRIACQFRLPHPAGQALTRHRTGGGIMTGPTLLFTERGALEARSADTLRDLLSELGAADEAKLLLFAHGGLVAEAHGVDTATRLDSAFDAIGYGSLKADGWALAYLIWHSDLAEVVESHRDELSRQGLFVRIVLRVLAWAERHVAGAESALSLATDDLPTAMDALDPAQERRGDDLADTLEPDMATKALNADALLEEQLEQSDLAEILAADTELGALAEAEIGSVDGEIRER
eukprot:gene37160-50133_t